MVRHLLFKNDGERIIPLCGNADPVKLMTQKIKEVTCDTCRLALPTVHMTSYEALIDDGACVPDQIGASVEEFTFLLEKFPLPEPEPEPEAD